MAHPAVRGASKSYSIGRKRVVSWWLRRWPCPLVAKGFQFFAHFKNSEFPLIMRVSESGPEVGVREVRASRSMRRGV